MLALELEAGWELGWGWEGLASELGKGLDWALGKGWALGWALGLELERLE